MRTMPYYAAPPMPRLRRPPTVAPQPARLPAERRGKRTDLHSRPDGAHCTIALSPSAAAWLRAFGPETQAYQWAAARELRVALAFGQEIADAAYREGFTIRAHQPPTATSYHFPIFERRRRAA